MRTWAKVSPQIVGNSSLFNRSAITVATSFFAVAFFLIGSISDQGLQYFKRLSASNFELVDAIPSNVSSYDERLCWQPSSDDDLSNVSASGVVTSQYLVNLSAFKQQKLPIRQSWMEFPVRRNFTGTLLQQIADNGTQSCHELPPTQAKILGLPLSENGQPVRLSTGIVHNLVLIAYDANGTQRCAGGDYFETDLSGPGWKSRPPISDLGNGTYSMFLQVHPSFAGLFTLRVVLLFGNFQAFHRRPERWIRNEEMLSIEIEFLPIEGETEQPSSRNISNSKPAANLLEMKQCSEEDFQRLAWTGRWTREKFSSKCEVNKEGRFICIDLNETCSNGWCQGPVGALESNGWVYSAHCSFQIFSEEAAWKCLDKKWIYFWGDSNHVDTIRNLLNFVLGFRTIPSVSRKFDTVYRRTVNSSQSVRITSLFNGNSNVSGNYQGLFSLTDAAFRNQSRYPFTGDSVPDFVIMNSGLHDGPRWGTTGAYAVDGAENAARFWRSVLRGVKFKSPTVLYRTTVAPAAQFRAFPSNPHKMEAYNLIFLEKLREMEVVSKVVDGFDLTFPWHFDHNCSDGVHYGKPPAAREWYGQMGHQYFVDLMLIHILLHAICLN